MNDAVRDAAEDISGVHSAAVDGAPSQVSALESPLVQQTKSEIRSIAAEIARLAHSQILPLEFYHGFLSRLQSAMGATGGAVWGVSSTIELLCSHQLPAQLLLDENAPSESHRQILQCVISEQQPILVPPARVKVDAARPTNPLDDALIIVPVRVQESIEILVEIVQRPTGGPAAQRGYLRFVAQMSDLLADYLRQHQLRKFAAEQSLVRQVEICLNSVASAENTAHRQRAAIEGLQSIFEAEHALLVSHGRRSTIVAIAGTGAFDPRSELILNAGTFAAECLAKTKDSHSNAYEIHDARDRRVSPNEAANMSPVGERLCDQLGCRRLLFAPLGRHQKFSVLLSYAEAIQQPNTQLPSSPEMSERLALSLGCLLEQSVAHSPLNALQRQLQSHFTSRHPQAWLWRSVAAAMIILCALMPVPQKINAEATLHPTHSQNYYAPMPATVAQVWVHGGEELRPGQVLLTLESPALNSQIMRLRAELAKTKDSIAEINELLGKQLGLSRSASAGLELKLHNYENEAAALADELQLRELDQDRLTVRARAAGRVSSWGLESRLLGRPVAADDLLISTYQPDSQWHFDVAIPENRLGLISKAIANQEYAQVSFQVTSFPDHILVGKLQDLNASSVSSIVAEQPDQSIPSVMARVEIETNSLPVRKDGIFAHAAIDCGHAPLIWVVFRDAVCHVSSRIRMLW
ncbi:MAG: efflux RND transporter periplasmic adaptor subunit [Pirellulaceae bacterium]